MKYITKAINALFALVLLAFAALQINDPDPVIWIGFYVICAAVPISGLLNYRIKAVFWLALCLCGITLFLYAPGAYQYYLHMTQEPLMQSMNPQKPYIEEAREFLGTSITLAFVVVSEWVTWHHQKMNS